MVRGAAVVFFAYIGFDAVSTAAQEAKNPQRDLPIGMLGSLAICTVLYMLMSLVMTGLVLVHELDVPAPGRRRARRRVPSSPGWRLHGRRCDRGTGVRGARDAHGSDAGVLRHGPRRTAAAGLRQGPPEVSDAVRHDDRDRHRSPLSIAAFFPVGLLGELVNDRHAARVRDRLCRRDGCCASAARNCTRPFKTPFVPLVPILGIVCCLGLMAFLPRRTWIRLDRLDGDRVRRVLRIQPLALEVGKLPRRNRWGLDRSPC